MRSTNDEAAARTEQRTMRRAEPDEEPAWAETRPDPAVEMVEIDEGVAEEAGYGHGV